MHLPSIKTKIIGDRVICRSNEYGPLHIGTIVDLLKDTIPIVKDDETGEVFYCGGIVVKYNEELLQQLNALPDFVQQWNALAENHVLTYDKFEKSKERYMKEMRRKSEGIDGINSFRESVVKGKQE